MAIVISNSLALTLPETLSANNPIVGYENLVTVSNISTTTEDTDFPATNMANPSTALVWHGLDESPAADEYITIDVNSVDELDYIAVARHNWGTAQITVSVEGLVDADASPIVWQELVEEFIPADDTPLIMRFTGIALSSIRIKLQPGSAAPQAAVVYTGALLVLQRRLYVGHTPLTYGRTARVVTGRSESGNFLGRIVLGESVNSGVTLQNLTPAWYRANFHPFVLDARENPFFFAWRPLAYPTECGFAWLTNEPRPVNQSANGMMSVTMEMTGIV